MKQPTRPKYQPKHPPKKVTLGSVTGRKTLSLPRSIDSAMKRVAKK